MGSNRIYIGTRQLVQILEAKIRFDPIKLLQVADLDKIWPIADEDLERTAEEKTSAVHFLRFELSTAQIGALKGGAELAAGIDHESCQVEIRAVAENIRRSLLGDLD